MKVHALIPARQGSKRLPGKNKKTLGGQPLWLWSVETAIRAGLDVSVSTDDPEISAAVYENGLARLLERPEALAADDTLMDPVVQHAFGMLPDIDGIVLLQPTQPFRSTDTVKRAVDTLQEGYDEVVAVHRRVVRCRMQRIEHLVETGSIYAVRRGRSLHQRDNDIRFLEVPWVESVDIDTAEDFVLAEQLVAGWRACG